MGYATVLCSINLKATRNRHDRQKVGKVPTYVYVLQVSNGPKRLGNSRDASSTVGHMKTTQKKGQASTDPAVRGQKPIKYKC